ncbi:MULTISPECIES: hypothetical protein [Bradyrhizobium]|uniref:Cytochrome-c oxidase n=1 Tax=Bradyrhizobium vignae TaxID=1549949 RepID=A0A2U3Q790_9BRAD|nr:hypothetical protein [Bradyrhizobium vignae]MBP0110273.1 hypothetical protein [Bradyrhizobium vignae]RXH02825.1 hypothetical protein EAV90_15445 [Bradyrhizobium vignae]SPP97282.1 conserved membrane protein of unknown function [Bradyrhizobium vignae]
MTDNPCARAWLRLAAIYFAAGVILGVVMGASGDHSLFPLHAHINLLGWVSMALFGLTAKAYPSVATGRAAGAQFWMHNVGVPVMLGALLLKLWGIKAAEPVLGAASIVVGLSVLLFAWLVITRIGTDSRAARSA